MSRGAENLRALCSELDERHVKYTVAVVRDSLMLLVALPGERWEMEFFDDGEIELERFVSQGVEDAPTGPADLLRIFDA